MAIVRTLERRTLERDYSHTEVECTYSVIITDSGEQYLQIDTYGSKDRQDPGKPSQTIRFSPEAMEQLRTILQSEFE